MFTVGCHNCNQPGHHSRNCPEPSNRRAPQVTLKRKSHGGGPEAAAPSSHEVELESQRNRIRQVFLQAGEKSWAGLEGLLPSYAETIVEDLKSGHMTHILATLSRCVSTFPLKAPVYAHFLALIRHKLADAPQQQQQQQDKEAAAEANKEAQPAEFVTEFVQKWLVGGLITNLRNLNWLRLKNWLRLCASLVSVGILDRSEVTALLQGLIDAAKQSSLPSTYTDIMVHAVLAVLPWLEVDHNGLEEVIGLLDRAGEYLVQKQARQEVFSLGSNLELQQEVRNTLRFEHLNPQLRTYPATGVQPKGQTEDILFSLHAATRELVGSGGQLWDACVVWRPAHALLPQDAVLPGPLSLGKDFVQAWRELCRLAAAPMAGPAPPRPPYILPTDLRFFEERVVQPEAEAEPEMQDDAPAAQEQPRWRSRELQILDQHLVRDVARDNLLLFESIPEQAAVQLMQLPFLTAGPSAVDPWKKMDHIALQELTMEAIMSELLLLPQPRLPIGYFAVVVANLFALDTAAMAPKFGISLHSLWVYLKRLGGHGQISERLASFFAHHLSNFDFHFPWIGWSKVVLNQTGSQPQRWFVCRALQHAAGLTFWDELYQGPSGDDESGQQPYPEGFQALMPPRPLPSFRYSPNATIRKMAREPLRTAWQQQQAEAAAAASAAGEGSEQDEQQQQQQSSSSADDENQNQDKDQGRDDPDLKKTLRAAEALHHQLVGKARRSPEEVLQWLRQTIRGEEASAAADAAAAETTFGSEAEAQQALELFLPVLLQAGALSFSHTNTLLSRYQPVFETIFSTGQAKKADQMSDSEDSAAAVPVASVRLQLALMDLVQEFWKADHSRLSQLLERFVSMRLLRLEVVLLRALRGSMQRMGAIAQAKAEGRAAAEDQDASLLPETALWEAVRLALDTQLVAPGLPVPTAFPTLGDRSQDVDTLYLPPPGEALDLPQDEDPALQALRERARELLGDRPGLDQLMHACRGRDRQPQKPLKPPRPQGLPVLECPGVAGLRSVLALVFGCAVVADSEAGFEFAWNRFAELAAKYAFYLRGHWKRLLTDCARAARLRQAWPAEDQDESFVEDFLAKIAPAGEGAAENGGAGTEEPQLSAWQLEEQGRRVANLAQSLVQLQLVA